MMGGGGPKAMRIREIAGACHEVNRIWCRMHGDDSQPHWEDAPNWQRQSAIDGVASYVMSPGMTPEESHARWMDIKHKEGWVYGPIKDPDRKEHPCMLPWSELPPEQRAKDHLFVSTIRMFLDAQAMK